MLWRHRILDCTNPSITTIDFGISLFGGLPSSLLRLSDLL